MRVHASPITDHLRAELRLPAGGALPGSSGCFDRCDGAWGMISLAHGER